MSPAAKDVRMPEEPGNKPPDEIFEEAVRWHGLLREPGAAAADHARFALWLDEDPRHGEAYAEAVRLWEALGAPVAELAADASLGSALAQRRRRGRLATALAAAAAFAAAAWLWQGGLDDLRSDHVTAVGGQDEIALADGSRMLLNTDTALAVEMDDAERRVRLFRGEALFEVARDPARPFIVDTDDGEVRVTGTAFNLRATGGGTVVSVLKGRVSVTPAAADQPVRLQRGQQVVVGPDGVGPVTGFDPTAVTAWQRGQVVFYRTPLGQVVQELNRYQYGRILVLSDRARDLEVTGVFDARNPPAVIDVIEAALDLDVVRLTDRLILLR